LLKQYSELSCQENYFPKNSIAMEKLNVTLSGTIKLWKDRGTSGIKRFRHRQKCFGNNHLWQTQIRVLSEIADAMEYLHSKKIILRDLKTENCGFDSAGKIKLFDFGLATGLRDEKKVGPDRYLFSVEGGTLRYMSPEAALGNPYGKASDVYSFALLAWETTSLSIPFESMRTDEFMTRVLERHHRPKMPTKWPKDLKALLTKSWTANASARPSFLQIQRQLDRLSSTDEGKGNSATFAKQRLQSRRYFSWILRSRS
jgi:serine/threonine protein kinase